MTHSCAPHTSLPMTATLYVSAPIHTALVSATKWLSVPHISTCASEAETGTSDPSGARIVPGASSEGQKKRATASASAAAGSEHRSSTNV